MAQVFTIKSFKGGISDWEDKGIRGAFKAGSGLSIRRRRDSLYCNQALVSADNETPVVVDLIRFTVPASDGKTYLFGESKIYEQASNGTITLKYTDPDGQICGAEEMWQANDKKYLFWVTSQKVKCKEIPGESDWSDVNADIVVGADTYTYPKTNLTASTNHTAAIANGALLICNGNNIAAVFFDGSYTNDALRLLPDMKATTIIDKNDFAIIGTETFSGRANAHLFEWETGSLNYISKQKISAPSINALIDGEIMLMQGGTNGQLFFGDFVNRLPITSIPSGGRVNPGAIIEDDGVIYMGVYGSTDSTKDGIYSYGRNKKNGDFVLNFEYPIVCDEIGALEIIGGVLHVSYEYDDGGGTDYYWYKVDITAKQVAIFESIDLLAPVGEALSDTTWLSADLFLSELPDGCTVEVKYRVDKATSSWISAQLDGDTSVLSEAGSKRVSFVIGSIGEVIELQVILTPTGNTSPEVHRIKLYLE